MKIKFLQDFQGVETSGVFYKLNQVVDLDYGLASRLVADKRAEKVEEQNSKQVETVIMPEDILTEVHETQLTAKHKRGTK